MNPEMVSFPPPPPPPCLIKVPATALSTSKSLLASRVCASSFNENIEEIVRSYIHHYRISVQSTYIFTKITPSLVQSGPCCGLVALSIGLSMLGYDISPEILFDSANNAGSTRSGEMFSVYEMGKLARSNSNVEATAMNDMRANRTKIVHHLMQGWPVLVPYDADANHEPTSKNGHKAHWAVLIGGTVLETFERDDDVSSALDKFVHFSPKLDEQSSKSFFSLLDKCNSKLIILAKQGKSKFTKAWDFEQLCDSNKNLMEVDPKLDDINYVLPKNRDLRDNLCNKFLLIKSME